MTEQSTWIGMWLTLLAIVVATGAVLLARITRNSWRRTSARLAKDLPQLLDDPIRTLTSCDLGMHPGPLSRYSNYAIWLCCGQREEQAYDVELADGTDLGQWEAEIS